MRDFFKGHFTNKIVDEDPIELEEVPDYIKTLQDITTQDINTGPPDEDELRGVIKNLNVEKHPVIYQQHT